MQLPDRTFVVQELGLAELPTHMQDALIADVGQNMYANILIAILERLPEDAATTFRALTEEGHGDEAEHVARTHIPELDELISTECSRLLAEFKELRAKT